MARHTVNPTSTRGENGDYRRLTITLPPEFYERLVRESTYRKIASLPNQLLSSILREAVVDYLERLDRQDGVPLNG